MAHAIKVRLGTPITLQNTGGDYALTLKNLSSGTGRISARVDLGADPRPPRYIIRVALTTAALTIATSNYFNVYVATSDGTTEDGDVGTTDTAVSAITRLYNLPCVLTLTPDVSSGTTLQGSCEVPISSRYISIGVWNNLGVATANSDGTSFVTVTPAYDEVQ